MERADRTDGTTDGTLRFVPTWMLAGMLAAIFSLLALSLLTIGQGLTGWAALNATTHAIHGPEVARSPVLDWSRTGLGTLIHVAAAFFWAGVAVGLARLVRLRSSGGAWLVGLGTAALAGLVDYGILPRRLTPGWELVLPPWGVALGLLALGLGLALGLTMALRSGIARQLAEPPAPPVGPVPRMVAQPQSATDYLRAPLPDMLDQRQQRIDPALHVTDDPNRTHPAPDHPDQERKHDA